MGVLGRRFTRMLFEHASAGGRFAGSGGGSGLSAAGRRQLAVTAQSGNQNFASTSFASVTGTSQSWQIGAGGTAAELRAFVTGKVTAGANNGLWIILLTGPGGYSNQTGPVYNGGASFITQYAYLSVTLTTPGLYTAVIQAAVDVGGTTFNLPGNSTALEAIALG